MSASTSNSLSTLLQKATIDDHNEILKACNIALKKSKNDLEAQQAKAVALLKLDRFDEALHHFEASGKSLQEESPLPYAYTLYKTGKLAEAAKIASTVKDSRGAKHVEAQATYRAEKFSRTLDLYKLLVAEQVAAEEYDLRVNRGALEAQQQWAVPDSIPGRRPSREDLQQFEVAYNAACGSIARGEFEEAEFLLERARLLCDSSIDLSDEEKADELLPINVQRLYVLQRLGKTEQANSLASEIALDKIPDISTRNIAQNNVLAGTDAPSNPFLLHKTFNSSPKIPDSDKLFSYQSRALISNARIIDLQSLKFDGVAASTAKDISKKPQPSVSPEVTVLGAHNAAAHAKAEVGKAALNLVLPELEKRPNDVGLTVTVLQLYTLTNNSTAAIQLLESLFARLEKEVAENSEEARYNPGLVSIMLALYKGQGRKSAIKQELAKVASYWRHKSVPPVKLLQSAGQTLLTSSDPKDIKTASEIFTKLREQDPKSKATIAGYVASHADESPSKLKGDLEKLTPVSDLIQDIDVDALETAGIPQSSNALAIAQAGSRKRKAIGSTSSKPKRIRKSRLPKGYDPEKPGKPDPERWLPLRDRSSYRPKGKRKGKKGGGDDRTQGGVVADDVGVNSTTSKQTAGTVVTGGGGGGGGASKNKKKKGKK